MASVDGSRSLQVGSDEIHDQICGPCITDGVTKEARHYCQDCSEYICDACKDYHRKLSVTKNHLILSGSKVPASASKRFGLQILCNCNSNQEVQHYCTDHQEVVCSPCKSFKHHKCKMTTIQQMSLGYETSTLALVLSKTSLLRDKYAQLKQQSSGNIGEVKRLKEACKNDISMFRKELNTFLDKLEQDMLAELHKYEREEEHRSDENISTLTTALKLLDIDCKLLENAKKDGRKAIMFASDVQVTKSLQGYESRLAELEKDEVKPSLLFERNKKLTDLQLDIKTLGYLKCKYRTDSQSGSFSDKKMLLGRKVQSCYRVNIRSGNDENIPRITGCTVMPGDCVVLCDYSNYALKLLDKSFAFTGRLDLPCRPWDVSVVDTNNIIVSLPANKQLQYVSVFPQMKACRIIQLDKISSGVDVAGNEIYTSCYNEEQGAGEVRVLDLNGNLKRRLGANQDGSFMFTRPSYVTVNRAAQKVFVSDSDIATIICMTADGSIVYKYRDKDMENPQGLICDSRDNIVFCDIKSQNLQQITAGGSKYGTLLKVTKPCCIVYRESDDIFVIGCYFVDNVFIFKLTK